YRAQAFDITEVRRRLDFLPGEFLAAERQGRRRVAGRGSSQNVGPDQVGVRAVGLGRIGPSQSYTQKISGQVRLGWGGRKARGDDFGMAAVRDKEVSHERYGQPDIEE